MKKFQKDFVVVAKENLDSRHVLLKLHPCDGVMPYIRPGQFVQVMPNAAKNTLLRLPISVNNVEENLLWLLVQVVGDGTKALSLSVEGDKINLVLPLGNGFSIEETKGRVLLVGGGVGIAPLLFAGRMLKDRGAQPVFLLGARTASGVLECEEFEQIGRVLITTEDATLGERGFVTQHSALQKENFDKILVCGPKPMMLAVAHYAKQRDIDCEVSLENTMACGLGACLCCVEKTMRGNVCVCTEGPVFNIKELTWQI